MVVVFTEVVDDLREMGGGYIGVVAGSDNEYLHQRELLLRIGLRDGGDASAIREFLDGVETVHWQGEEWGFDYGLFPESVAQSGATHDIYIRGEGTDLDALFDAWRRTWMEELSECSLGELEEDKRWRFLAKEVREASGYELSPRMSQVYALDTIGRTTEEIATLLDMSESNVENRRRTTEERVGERDFISR